MKRTHRRSLAFLFCALAGLSSSATEVYDTRTGEVPSWVRPKAPEPASERLAAQRREAERTRWLEASPIGSRDYCASTAVISSQPSSAKAQELQCFHGSTSEAELRAKGWELTDVRRSIHRHSPGYEVEVINTIAVKRKCFAPADGQLRDALSGRYGCEGASRDDEMRPGLFWMPES